MPFDPGAPISTNNPLPVEIGGATIELGDLNVETRHASSLSSGLNADSLTPRPHPRHSAPEGIRTSDLCLSGPAPMAMGNPQNATLPHPVWSAI